MLLILQQYKSIIQPLLIVLVLDIFLFVGNFLIADQLQTNANYINMAGRQRMLSQKVTKELGLLYIYNKSMPGQPFTYNKFDELQRSANLFDETLNAFINGGQATTAAGEKIVINKLVHEEAQNILQEAN